MSYDMNITELQEKETLQDEDLFVVEDKQNTKNIKFRNLVKSIISDAELPTEDRIYSALKIKRMIDTLDTKYMEALQEASRTAANIKEFGATKKMLEELQEELLVSINEKATPNYVDRAIENLVSKDHKFTASDFDTSSDEVKIKIENLAQEVIDMITGEAVVEISNRAPKGGWRTEDFADGSIVANKLSKEYRYRGNKLDGNIDEFVEDGIYLLSSSVRNMPSDNNESDDELRLLKVTVYGDYIEQELHYITNLEYHPIFRRKCKRTRLHATEFVRIDEISDVYKISRLMLSDDYASLPKLDGHNIYNIKQEGNFIALSNCIGLPTKDKYLINVKRFDDYTYIYQAYNMSVSKCEIYMSLVYCLENYSVVNTEWFKTTNSERSKFEGKKLHIIGDDIVFGIGSSEIGKKAIPALLGSKYGFVVNNCALSDATAGNYNDEIMAKYDINEQIVSTSLTDTDYVLIFIGTNDYRCGKAQIGYNGDTDSNSFKGGLNLAIGNIYAANPKAKILLASPIYRDRLNTVGDGHNGDNTLVNDYYLTDFANAMSEVAKYNHIPFLNLTDTCGINKYNASAYLSDGLHLNDLGQELIADKIFDGFNQYY